MYKVYYIMHSCFVVELDDRYLLFDYFDKNVISDTVNYGGSLPEFSQDKKLYVFASHSHKDHWWVQNLKLADTHKDTKFILSKDIRLGRNFLVRNGIDLSIKEQIQFVKPLSKYQVDDMEIITLRSTDAGVAFVVEACGKRIYHAGDLSWWNVEGRGELYGEVYGKEYRRALRQLLNKRIDVAFVVLDPRMGEDGYFLGLDYFIKNFECDYIFPMHMWGEYQWIERFKKRPDVAMIKDRVIDIDRENMIFEIEE